MKFILNTDGGARGNPGPAGIGFVISDGSGKVLKEGKSYIGEATNNYAEYKAAVEGLLSLKKILSKEEKSNAEVVLRLDSELVVRQLNGVYQIQEESLFPFFIAIHNFRVKEFTNLKVVHVPRSENKEADRLVNEAIDEYLENK